MALAATYGVKTSMDSDHTRFSQHVTALRPSHAVRASHVTNGTYPGISGSITAQTALGAIAGQSPMPTFSVFPNPAHGQTNVQVSGPGGADYKLRLTNVLGSEVRRLLVRPDNQSTAGFALDLSDLPPGLYFCSLLVNDKTLVTKRITVL